MNTIRNIPTQEAHKDRIQAEQKATTKLQKDRPRRKRVSQPILQKVGENVIEQTL